MRSTFKVQNLIMHIIGEFINRFEEFKPVSNLITLLITDLQVDCLLDRFLQEWSNNVSLGLLAKEIIVLEKDFRVQGVPFDGPVKEWVDLFGHI